MGDVNIQQLAVVGRSPSRLQQLGRGTRRPDHHLGSEKRTGSEVQACRSRLCGSVTLSSEVRRPCNRHPVRRHLTMLGMPTGNTLSLAFRHFSNRPTHRWFPNALPQLMVFSLPLLFFMEHVPHVPPKVCAIEGTFLLDPGNRIATRQKNHQMIPHHFVVTLACAFQPCP